MVFLATVIIISWIVPTIVMIKHDMKVRTKHHSECTFVYPILLGCYLFSRVLASFAYYFVVTFSEQIEYVSKYPEYLKPTTLIILYFVDIIFWLLFRRWSPAIKIAYVIIISLAQSIFLIFFGMLLPLVSEIIVVTVMKLITNQ